ncbi:hypothetical protein MKW92_024786 [Papaver armeniacum]|nr:hypothetical protein MKW92_024786 [Papaver armeniacum]
MNVQTDHLIEDRIVWTAGQGGDYTLRDTYNALRAKGTKKNWKSIVWFAHCIPRHCFIVWVALNRGLKTRFKLLSWGMDVNPVCVLCNLMIEDDMHLLFNCCYSVQVWDLLCTLLGIRFINHRDWEVQIQWVVAQFAGPKSVGTLKKLACNACIYHLWGERNRRIFTQKSVNPEVLFHMVKSDVKLKMASADCAMLDTNENRHLAASWGCVPKFTLPKQITTTWKRPAEEK